MDDVLPIGVNIDGALLITMGLVAWLAWLGFAGLQHFRAETAVLERLHRQAARLGRGPARRRTGRPG
ncbi:hypothetical protein [Phreatobacter stygius]|uniref:Uncharacterized protein n=1 Tax=Phreatobacter stygius TaxID=1940610 RepID=A0A4D7BHE5_9HYPH|nr:hypothetical protein [Phreatobacter stygius]QCI67227.1 hypothetical protein E8M01_25130 [Phreatobacter stygius]